MNILCCFVYLNHFQIIDILFYQNFFSEYIHILHNSLLALTNEQLGNLKYLYLTNRTILLCALLLLFCTRTKSNIIWSDLLTSHLHNQGSFVLCFKLLVNLFILYKVTEFSLISFWDIAHFVAKTFYYMSHAAVWASWILSLWTWVIVSGLQVFMMGIIIVRVFIFIFIHFLW